MKVISAAEMARVEALAIEAGCSREAFMLQAGSCVAEVVERFLPSRDADVVILAWKGNKSGDGFVAGLRLLEKGFRVRAVHIADLEQCSPLCKKFLTLFKERGGMVQREFCVGDLFLDALLGTGCSGAVEGGLRACIEQANGSGVPIVSIDLPSGLDGNTGTGECVIRARATVALGAPKSGCFLRGGWNCTGELFVADFGLPERYAAEARAVACLPERDFVRRCLPNVVRNRHKYQAGCVAGYAGSKRYSGAAKLAAWAALKSGAGMVKLFFPRDAEWEMLNAPYELIRLPWDEDAWDEGEADAFFVGPGLGVDGESWVRAHVSQRERVVVDADALVRGVAMPRNSICTPHRGEMQRLLGEEVGEERLLEGARLFCEEQGVVVVLKGAPTWVFVPGKVPFLMIHGDPGMATAGSGDVLTGLLASLLAQGASPEQAALVGTTIHGLAGEEAARVRTSYCVTAGDLIEFFPHAFKKL